MVPRCCRVIFKLPGGYIGAIPGASAGAHGVAFSFPVPWSAAVLILTRKVGESVDVGAYRVVVVRTGRGTVRLGIERRPEAARMANRDERPALRRAA